jgi:hypothetical protein
MIADILTDIFAEYAEVCEVAPEGGAEAYPALIVLQGRSVGAINPRNNLLPFLDKKVLPQGADWEYGLIMAADAPQDMQPVTRLTVIDSTGRKLSCEAAQPVYELDRETRVKSVVAWRMAMRGKQRAIRGK